MDHCKTVIAVSTSLNPYRCKHVVVGAAAIAINMTCINIHADMGNLILQQGFLQAISPVRLKISQPTPKGLGFATCGWIFMDMFMQIEDIDIFPR